ncbi:MAG: heme-degrading domain-containing protein [Clostridia bacterium]
MLNIEDTIVRLEQEEALLQFEHFSNDDAWTLGSMLVAKAKLRGVMPAFEIIVNGYTVFRYAFAHTNLHNDMWLKRKSNTVHAVHMSSLHVGALLKKNNEDISHDWLLSAQDYAVLGGGFPLTLKGTGVIGSICCSGLPHETDHQIIVDTIAEFLQIASIR